MKIAISGKGGVGKTTLSAFLCKWFGDQGNTVLAIDADPATNLGTALAISGADSLPPITEMKDEYPTRSQNPTHLFIELSPLLQVIYHLNGNGTIKGIIFER